MPNPETYTVGWICAIATEYTAARQFLDEEHERPEYVSPHDSNDYTLGRVGKHHIVIAVLPDGEYGLSSATGVAKDMLHSFPNIRIGLMVGIGGGAPSAKHDVRLGDVVVSSPSGGTGGVYQYDYGKTVQGQAFQQTGVLDQPPTLLRAAVNGLRAQYESDGHQLEETISAILERKQRLRKKYGRPDQAADRLFKATAIHPLESNEDCANTCVCDQSSLVPRPQRDEDEDNPAIHYGLIASANQLMKDAMVRDTLAKENGVLCFEMEAAGLMNRFPCLVIRGICDYSDSHKNKDWQGYAAMAAAAYAKDLLGRIPPNRIEAEKKITELIPTIAEGLYEIRSVTRDTNAAIKDSHAEHHRDKISAWLSAPDPSTNYNKALQQRHQGSGQWFLQSSAYSAWKTGRNSFLWLYGIPGCGKTILSSNIIEDLEQRDASQKPLYFYFDFTDTYKQSLNKMVRSLTSQLYRRESVQRHLHLLYSSCEDGKRQPSVDSLCKTFQDMAQQVGEVWIVLDALDECQTRKENPAGGLLPWMEQLLGSQQTNVHLLVTSRPEQDIKSAIENWARKQDIIPIQSDLVTEDIRAYVHTRVRKHQGLSRWQSRPEVQEEIEAALTEKANGMFRWVSCQLDALEDCLDYPTLQKALESLPKTLDETYARILTHIPDGYKHQTIRILQFLAFSERPLQINEAVDAIAVNTEIRPYFKFQNRMPVPEEISKCCSSLVVIVTIQENQSGEGRKEIQLAHFSVKEYLTSTRLEKDVAKDLEEAVARASIAKVCLAYLLELDKNLPAREIRKPFALAQYSARHWMEHAVAANSYSGTLCALEIQFFSDKGAYRICCQLYNPDIPWKDKPDEERAIAPTLYYASLVGLVYSVQTLLDKGVDVNAQDGRYGNALQAASSGGHVQVVQILLEKNADVNAQGGEYGNALQAASSEGHIEVVQTLLDKGADVNAQGGPYGNALQAASSGGHVQVVQMLLEKNADVNAQGGEYGNALQAASSEGHDQVVQILLEKNADVNARGNFYDGYIDEYEKEVTLLYAASLEGHVQVVQMLLEKNADVNAQGGRYGNALQAALNRGHIQVVQMLLEKNADVNARGNFYDGYIGEYEEEVTLLYAASLEGHVQVVQMLLEKNADVNIQGGEYGNALQAASNRGHIQVVQMLLEKNADVNAQGGEDGNALQAASSGGHVQVVRMLLKKNADVNAQGGEYGNALQAASSGGHVQVVRMLLEKNADVNAQGGYYGNALQAASSEGHDQMVQILLEKNADVNARGNFYNGYIGEHKEKVTPLYAASLEGHVQVVQMLLEKNADVNAQGGYYGNALQAASFRGYVQVVQILLEQNADVNAQGGVEGNALQAASCGGHEKVVQILLYSGSNVNIPGGYHSNALHAASEGGHDKVVQILLQNTANVSAVDKDGWTSFHAAARKDLTTAKALYQAGANIHARSNDGWTPLHEAACFSQAKIAQWLLSLGADISATSKHGWTPLHEAIIKNFETAKLLQEKGADIHARSNAGQTILYKAAASGQSEIVQWLLSLGADFLAADEDGWTPLHAAVKKNLETAKLLHNAGANIHARSNRGCTILHSTASSGQLETTRWLLSLGLNPNEVDVVGQSPLHLAAGNDKPKIATVLLDSGASINLTDILDRTPLHHSIYTNSDATLELLLSRDSDPHILDGYGKSAFEWIQENDYLKRNFSSLLTSPQNTQRHDTISRLRRSIRTLTSRLLDNADYTTNPGYHELGHCLMYLNETTEALIAYQQQIVNRPDNSDVTHDVTCRNCSANPIHGIRYICRACPDIDLCGGCWSKYDESNSLRSCLGHDFVLISKSFRSIESDIIINSARETRISWLERIREGYGPRFEELDAIG